MSATIFNGSKVKTLKSILSLNGGAEVHSGTVDVQTVATSAPAGSIYQRTDTGDVYRKLDSGSSTNWVLIGSGGSGGLNFVGLDSAFKLTSQSDIDAEVTVGNHAAYADAAGVEPVNMTGGSPGTTVTRSATSPLNGAASILMDLGSGSSRQGEGHSLLVNIPAGYRGLRLEYSFAFKVTGSLVEDDLRLAVYDVTNSQLITDLVQVNKVMGSAGIARVQFAPDTSCTQIRVGLHVARVSTGALSVKMDDFSVSPKLSTIGVAGSDWYDYTPTSTTGWSGQATYTGKWRRVGDSMEVYAMANVTGSPSGYFTLTLPTGYTIDTAKIPPVGSGTVKQSVGVWSGFDGTNVLAGTVALSPTVDDVALILGGNIAADYVAGAGFASPDNISLHFTVPISGWSSNVTMASDPGAIPVVAKATGAVSSTSAGNILIWPSEDYDSHGAYDTGTGQFTCPVAGQYHVTAAGVGNNNGVLLSVYKNGSLDVVAGATNTNNQFAAAAVVNCAKGDTLDLRPDATLSVSSGGHLSFDRITGSTTLAIEGPRQELTIGVSGTPPGFGSSGTATLRFDTVVASEGTLLEHVDSSTDGGRIIVHSPGVYAMVGGSNNAAGTNRQISIIRNSTDLTSASADVDHTVASGFLFASGFGTFSGTRRLNAGDFITLQADPAMGSGATAYTFLRVTKVAD